MAAITKGPRRFSKNKRASSQEVPQLGDPNVAMLSQRFVLLYQPFCRFRFTLSWLCIAVLGCEHLDSCGMFRYHRRNLFRASRGSLCYFIHLTSLHKHLHWICLLPPKRVWCYTFRGWCGFKNSTYTLLTWQNFGEVQKKYDPVTKG